MRGLTAADDRARGRRAPSEARAFGYVRTNLHVFQQSPPLPFGHFDAVRRAGIRLPPRPPDLGEWEASIPFLRAGIASPLLSKGQEHAVSGYRRAFTTSGTAVPLPPDSMFHFLRIRCSTSSGFDVPLPPDSVFHFLRNTQSAHGLRHDVIDRTDPLPSPRSAATLASTTTRSRRLCAGSVSGWARSLRRRRFAARNGSPAHDLSHVSGRLRRSAGRGGFSVVGEQMTKFGPHGPHRPPETAMRIDLSPL